jgi:hypothetical protein
VPFISGVRSVYDELECVLRNKINCCLIMNILIFLLFEFQICNHASRFKSSTDFSCLTCFKLPFFFIFFLSKLSNGIKSFFQNSFLKVFLIAMEKKMKMQDAILPRNYQIKRKKKQNTSFHFYFFCIAKRI